MGFEIENGVLKKYKEEDGVTDVVIPDGVKIIGRRAFEDSKRLTGITIPESVASIEYFAFSECASLTSINVSGSSKFYLTDNGVLFNKDKTKIIKYPAGKKNTEYIIPESVKSIGKGAFDYCKSLISITIPEGITNIVSYAFYSCNSLTSITIPESVTSIGEWAFSGCESLKSITIPESVTSIGDCAFSCCKRLTSIKIPDGVASIGRNTFYWCDSLASITISESITSIGRGAFNGCTSLTDITIPDSVKSIGENAFNGCESLTGITIPDGITSIGIWAFEEGQKITFTENGVSYKIKLEGDWNYKVEEKRLNNFVFEKDNAKRQEIFTGMENSDYKIPLALFMMSAYDGEFFKAYVKESFTEAMEYIIDNNDISMLLKIFETGFLTKKNIDKHINYAIENTQKGGSLELQMTLMRYKHDNFPETDDKTKRFII